MRLKLLCILICLTILTGCGAGSNSLDKTDVVDSNNSILDDVVTMDICDERLTNYLKAEEVQEQYNFLKSYTYTDLMHQTLNLVSDKGDGSNKYTFVFSLDSDFSNSFSVESFTTRLTDAKVLIPGKHYYWKMFGNDKNTELDSGEFYVNDDVVARPITLDGVGNTRDIGGWYTENGTSVKYGMIYRGRNLNDITEDGIQTLRTLGIKSELDIRSPSNNPSAVEGVGLDYHFVDTQLQYDKVFEENNKEKLQKTFQAIFNVLSNEENYPIYIHCQHGADRTGTVTFFLNGLLGVSYEDLTRDFEMTSFTTSPGKRWRGTGISGTFSDTDLEQLAEANYIAWGKLHKETMEQFGTDNERLSSAIENFLVNYVNIPVSQIDEFKRIMLSEN